MDTYSWSAVAVTLIVQAGAVALAWIRANAKSNAAQEAS